MLHVFVPITKRKSSKGPEQPEELELVWERDQLCDAWSLRRVGLTHLPQPHLQPLQLQLPHGLVGG